MKKFIVANINNIQVILNVVILVCLVAIGIMAAIDKDVSLLSFIVLTLMASVQTINIIIKEIASARKD